jgi:hypothetical protein
MEQNKAYNNAKTNAQLFSQLAAQITEWTASTMQKCSQRCLQSVKNFIVRVTRCEMLTCLSVQRPMAVGQLAVGQARHPAGKTRRNSCS